MMTAHSDIFGHPYSYGEIFRGPPTTSRPIKSPSVPLALDLRLELLYFLDLT